jgi:hypothetical protein
MHRPEDFAEHFIGLLKSTGSSGSSGSDARNILSNKVFAGTTGARPREPVKSEWFSGVQSSGSNNSIANQSLAAARTTRTTRTTTFEESLNEDNEGRAPVEWHAILAELEQRNCPDWLLPDRWNGLLSDAESFLDRWGNAAHQLGWTALDLFGVHPEAPSARFDKMGLLLLICGGELIALTAGSATIRRSSGAVLTYRRSDLAGAVLLSGVLS